MIPLLLEMKEYGSGTWTVPTDDLAPSSLSLLLIVSQLGWTASDAAASRHRLEIFENEWDAPGMEAYDQL